MTRPARATVGDRALPAQGSSRVHVRRDEDTLCVLRTWLAHAIDDANRELALVGHEQWTRDAIAAEMGLPDGQYVSKLLTGEKQLQAWHFLALPDDIERCFFKRWIESLGLVVVPRLDDREARLQFAAGLFSLLCGAGMLPTKADRLAKAGLS